MRCIKTVSYSFNINGETKEYIIPDRGIRQGDPLSPYLFLVCSEGFSSLIKKTTARKEISGLKISRQGPVITYLLFADYDTLVFCKANESNAQKLKEILHQYEESSGQSINLEKSSVIFNKNIKNDQKKKICEIFFFLKIKMPLWIWRPLLLSARGDRPARPALKPGLCTSGCFRWSFSLPIFFLTETLSIISIWIKYVM